MIEVEVGCIGLTKAVEKFEAFGVTADVG